MAVIHNLRGTSHPSFRIGKEGPALHQGTTAPNGIGTTGDLYIRTGSLPRLYQKNGTDWIQLTSTQQVVQVKAADYQTQLPDEIVLVDTTLGPVTITLGNTSVKSGKTIVIKDAAGTAGINNITIQGQGGQEIDGALTHVIEYSREAVKLVCDGTDWHLI